MFFLMLGCAARVQTPEPQAVVDVDALPSLGMPESNPPGPLPGPVQVGMHGWSMVYGSTLSGRTVILVEFGADRPQFGHHGEPFGAQPTLRAWDTVSGESSEIVDLIEVSADRRHVLVQDVGGVWLIDDAGAWRQLEGVSGQGDGNRCLPPRQAGFSLDGSRVGWVNEDNSALMVMDLESGGRWQVDAEGPLWRGWPDNSGQGASLLELTEESQDWPRQNTSCACRWCNAFALSYGVYGWSGPEFESVHVDGEGVRGEPIEQEGGGPTHGPNANGCILESASPIEDPLQHGPWRWVCTE